jgi:hypothetical protein
MDRKILLKWALELVEGPGIPEVIERNMAEVFTVYMAEQFHENKISVNV